jgi:hypothetical protein
MQTFLPYPDFQQSANCLDYRRLGKQRVEAYQIYNLLTGVTKPNNWSNHPAVKMWRGYESALALYHNVMIETWVGRGYRNNMKLIEVDDYVDYPCWFGSDDFHASHRSNLLRKDPKHYGQYGWTESPDLPYIWPISKPTRIRLKVDLPVERRHNCLAGNQYDVIDEKRDRPLSSAKSVGRLRLIGFVADSGETVYACPSECEFVKGD